ncbi:MAG: efflux RND transporter periplasmic adaptor subunit [Pseudomonadota bacterium]
MRALVPILAPIIAAVAMMAAGGPAAAQSIGKDGKVRGVVEAKSAATIGASMTGRITSMPFDEGDAFKRGQVLVAFDCSRNRAEAAAAHAAAGAARERHATNQELDSMGAIGTSEVRQAAADLSRARAEAKALDAAARDCTIYAPYAGRVVERIGNPSETPQVGAPLIRIQRSGDLELRLIVPSRWLVWLEPGTAFDFLVDETGGRHTGTVKGLGASVDPVSKTIRVRAAIDSDGGIVLPGMSGTARFRPPASSGTAPTRGG